MADQLNACKQLLYLSTQAQAGKPADKSIPPLSNENRAFLEEAIKEAANGSIRARDPVENLKSLMSQLKSNTLEHTEISELVEDLVDLVCGIDLALDFCKLGGLEIVKQHMIPTTSNNDTSSSPALFAGLLGVIAQNNPAVQEFVLNQEPNNHFLAHCLQTLVNDSASETYKVKCIGAISSMVRGYSPALKQLSQQNGVETLRRCFDQGLQKKEERLVERLAIAVANVVLSFEGNLEAVNLVVEKTQVVDMLKHIHDTLVELNKSGSENHSSALEYIQSNGDIMKHIGKK